LGVLASRARKKADPFPAWLPSLDPGEDDGDLGNQHLLFNEFGGLHNVYLNDLGVASLKQGKAYPDGTVFVFDLLDIRSAQGAIETRSRKFVAAMNMNVKLDVCPENRG